MSRTATIIRTVLGLLILAALAGLIYLFPLGGLEDAVNARIARLIGEDYPLEVDIGNIGGTVVTGLILEDVTVSYIGPRDRYRIAYFPKILATYSMSELLSRHWNFDEIRIESPIISLARDSAGSWVLPGVQDEEPEEKSELKLPELNVGHFEISDALLSLLQKDDTLTLDRLNLVVSYQSQEDTYSADIERLGFHSNRDWLYIDHAAGKITLSGPVATLSDVNLQQGSTRLKLQGQANTEELSGHLNLDVDNFVVDDLRNYTPVRLSGVVDVNGDVSFDRTGVNGTIMVGGEFQRVDFENLTIGFELENKLLSFDTLYGSVLGGCAVDGRGEIDFNYKEQLYRLQAGIRNFNLNNLVRNTFTSDLNGTIDLKGESFRSQTLTIEIAADLEHSRFDEYSFHRGLGSMLITSDSIIFADSFLFAYYENNFFVDGPIGYRDSLSLNIEADLKNLDRYRGKLFIDQPGGRGHARATMTGITREPDLKGTFTSDSVWIYGLYTDSMYARFDINRFITGKKGWVEVSFAEGDAWDIPYFSGYAYLTIDSNLVLIDTSNMAAEYATIAARGVVNHGLYPQLVTLDSVNVVMFEQELFNRSQIVFEVDSAGFLFTQANIGNYDADLSLLGRIDYDESMDLSVSAANIQIGPWVDLFEVGVPFDGALSLEASVGGTFIDPQFDLVGNLDSLRIVDTLNGGTEDLFLGDVAGSVSYDADLLAIDSLVMHSRPGVYRAEGQLHADLAFTTDSVDRLPDRPFDVQITAQDSRFDLVSYVMPSVEQLNGDMYVDVRLSGTPNDPHLEGFGHLRDASLKYFDLVDSIYADSAGVTMRDNQIVLDGVRAYVLGKKDSDTAFVVIDSVITVKAMDLLNYNLEVGIVGDMPFKYELEDMEGVARGRLKVQGDSPPLVSGNLTLLSMSYEVPFAEEDEGSPIMLALAGEDTWDLDLDIDVQPDFRVKNDDIDALFAGDLKLLREDGEVRFQGELEILRGKAYLLDKTFDIDPGSMVYFEGQMPPNPRLDITARTRIVLPPAEGEEERQEIELAVQVTGTLETPEISTLEGSEFAREDILPLLVADYYGGEMGAFDARFVSYISSQVADIGARMLGDLGVETLEIDPASEGELDWSQTRVTLGLYTPVPQLYVYGRSRPGTGQWGQEVGFEYRIAKEVLLEGHRSDRDEYILNLKLHFEF